MVTAIKPKVAYVLPRYDPAAGSHLFHLYELLAVVAGDLDLFLIVERAEAAPPFPAYCQRWAWPPLRFFELLVVLSRQRLAGRRYFYVHYSFYGAFAAWFVTRLLGGTVYYWNAGMPWLYTRGWAEEAVFRFILRHTTLVTGTAGLAREYAQRYRLRGERIRVMPNWVNVERFAAGPSRAEARRHLGIPPEMRVVLFVHRLSRRKGAHLLPAIIAAVTRELRDAVFLVVGDGPERDSLKSKVKSLKLEPYTRLVGAVPNRALPAYYRAADVLLMPSEEEGFPNVLLEAQASGLPYAASDVGGVREITPPQLQLYVVPSGGVAQFVCGTLGLLALSVTERASISAAEQEWVKRYDLRAVGQRFTALFDTHIGL